MKHILKDWDKIKKDLSNKFIALFLDYDGTLSPIVEKPEKAFISKSAKQLLCKLSKNPRCKLAIISGRALEDIKRRIGIDRIIYAGNHGLEIKGPNIRFIKPVSKRYKRILQHIKGELNTNLSTVERAFVEDKGLSLSIHYRLVDSSQIPKIKTILHEATILYTLKDKIKIKLGKKVFEIRPEVEWDKGKVVLWLLKKWKVRFKNKEIMPIYIGDDATDEDAFKVLKNKGISVFVGKPKKSYAKYYLKNTREVEDFLNRCQDLLKER